jgi:serine/threonine protein phosphatase PrpC
VLTPGQIASALLAARRDLAGAADRIIEQVLDLGAPDNATCVLVRWS